MLEVKPVTRNDCLPFILNIHYAKRCPSISYAYGLFDDGELIGICTYGSPASAPLCKGVAGEENRKLVIELNRLCLTYNRKNEASFLVSTSLRLLPRPLFVVSYADEAQKHLGIVYQACNFIFTGTSPKRTDIYAGEGKHPRHHLGDTSIRCERSRKHRYIFIVGSRTQKRKLKAMLLYKSQPYPKESPC